MTLILGGVVGLMVIGFLSFLAVASARMMLENMKSTDHADPVDTQHHRRPSDTVTQEVRQPSLRIMIAP